MKKEAKIMFIRKIIEVNFREREREREKKASFQQFQEGGKIIQMN